MIALLVFLFGLAVGSFLNAVIFRLAGNESVTRGRSHCVSCGQELAWRDLIPIFSFFALGGRCRSCHHPISWQYPAVEFAMGSLFLILFLWELTLHSPFFYLDIGYLFLVCSLLAVIFVYDLRHFIIPDEAVIPFLIVAFAYQVVRVLVGFHWHASALWKLGYGPSGNPVAGSLFAALVAGGFFFILFAVSRGRWMGFGDVKLAAGLGLFLSWPNILVALFFAFVLGALTGVSLMIFGGRHLRSEIPFAPFLIAGTLLALFFGDAIIYWYAPFPYLI